MKRKYSIGQQIGYDYPDVIKRVRGRLSLTQQALADLLGVSFPTINRWENGKVKPSQVCWSRLLELSQENDTSIKISEPELPPYRDTPPMLDFTTRPDIVRALVEGERLSFGHLANPIFASEVARIDPLPHQRIAVYDHMLKQTRLRFLMADDAGAGKTIMTGLYIREMLSRRLINRVLIIPPAGLVGNWQHELSSLFSMQFDIVEGSNAKNNNPFIGDKSNLLIVSIDTLASPRVFSRLQEKDVEQYDLVVFDEAHKLSCDRGNDYRIRKTDRYRLAEAISGLSTGDEGWRLPWHAHHLLLLTATPHMGKEYPYYALWRLLDPDILSTPDAFNKFPSDMRANYFIRRIKEEMVKLDGNPLYPKRIADTLGYTLSQGEVSEQKLYDETTEYLRHVYNKAQLLNQSAARLALGVFQRRLASSNYALLCSFERRIQKIETIIDDVSQGRITFDELLKRQRNITEEDDVFEAKTSDDETTEDSREENETAEDKLLQSVIAVSLADLQAEKEQVLQLRDLAQLVHESGLESKFDKFREIITDPKYVQEKLIVFTEHRDTLDFMVRRLGGMGYIGQIAMIHGGMHYTERQEQVERFRTHNDAGGARFMICTDAAAEGINLQFCWIMINYDIPWNPARLEQRMGRIHRYGQNHDPVVIINMVAPSTREGHVLKTLLDKLEKIRKQLRSDKVYDSIGRIFAGVSIREYMEKTIWGDADGVAQELDGILTKEQVKALADRERHLYGDGGDVKKELPRLRESMDQETFFRLLPGYVRNFIQSAAPLVGLKVDGDLGGFFTLHPVHKGAADPLLPALEVYPTLQRSRLCVFRPEEPNSCIWMHPGEPVFERFREIVRHRLGKDALQGAVFIDPTATKPYLFHVARLTVIRKADPEVSELAHEEPVECRMVGICQTEGADITVCPVEHLLLLSGGHGLPPEAQRMAVAAGKLQELAKAYLAERLARTMAVDRRSCMLESLPERESFVRRGFDFQEAELATARSKLSLKAREGNRAAAQHLSEIKDQQRAVSARRDRALMVLRREPELIIPGDIDFIAHALVVPTTDEAEVRQHQASVERIAMDLVKAFEESAEATVKLVHTPELARAANLPDNPGFDILSIRQDGIRRCIEVKGLAATGEIQVTDNEWARACNLRQDYWLYVVYDCATPNPQIVRVQDPFEKLLVKPFTRVQERERVIRTTLEVSGVRISHVQIMEVGEV